MYFNERCSSSDSSSTSSNSIKNDPFGFGFWKTADDFEEDVMEMPSELFVSIKKFPRFANIPKQIKAPINSQLETLRNIFFVLFTPLTSIKCKE